VSVFDLVLQIALNILLTARVVGRDMRRLPPALYRRGWNEASFWSAIVAFGPFCIPVHFVRTRRSLLGLVTGLSWMALVLAVILLVSEGVSWIMERLS
jgi:hypothetical protein